MTDYRREAVACGWILRKSDEQGDLFIRLMPSPNMSPSARITDLRATAHTILLNNDLIHVVYPSLTLHHQSLVSASWINSFERRYPYISFDRWPRTANECQEACPLGVRLATDGLALQVSIGRKMKSGRITYALQGSPDVYWCGYENCDNRAAGSCYHYTLLEIY